MKRLLIIPGIALVMLSAACAASSQVVSPVITQTGTGLVAGRFVLEGGPLHPGGKQPGERPISGLVAFSSGKTQVARVHVDTSGLFSIRLPAGRYDVTGRSPSVLQQGSGGINASGQVVKGRRSEPVCSQPLSVTVTPPYTSKITLTCIVP